MNVLDLLLRAKDSKANEDEEDIRNACCWLKEAGFPQYVQMYNDDEFPISLKLVQGDHMDFDGEMLMALFRRIEILNKASERNSESLFEENSATMIETSTYRRPHFEIIEDDQIEEKQDEDGDDYCDDEDEDEDDDDDDDDDKENDFEQTALSSNWSYEHRTRRWSHKDIIKKPETKEIEISPNEIGLNTFVFEPRVESLNKPIFSKSFSVNQGKNSSFNLNRTFEPIVELHHEIGDMVMDDEHDDTKDKRISSHMSDSGLNSMLKSESSKTNSKIELEKKKKKNYIFRSTSLKLMKEVSRTNTKQLSLKLKNDPKEINNDIFSESTFTNQKDSVEDELCFEKKDIGLTQLSSPNQPIESSSETFSVITNECFNNNMDNNVYQNGKHTEGELSSVSSDLDPVILRLQSDVDSLNEFWFKIKQNSFQESSSDIQNRDEFNKRRLNKNQRISDIETYTQTNKSPDIFCDDIIRTKSLNSAPLSKTQSMLNDHEKEKFKLLCWSNTNYSKDNEYLRTHHIFELSVNRINVLKKLSILNCTSLLEKHCLSHKNIFNRKIPKVAAQKTKLSLENSNFVFGLSLSVCQSRFGQPFPPAILNIFHYLRESSPTTQGVFRKTGLKQRVIELRAIIEKDKDLKNFEGYNVHDVVDIFKMFFRDLPDRLLSNKLSSTLLAIYNYIPKEYQYECLKWALFILPDENRIALGYLVEFLLYLSRFSEDTKMDVKNLSLCFAPTLFHFQNDGISNSNVNPFKKSIGPNSKLLAEQCAAHLCVMDMINNATTLFQIANETMKKASRTDEKKSEKDDVAHLVLNGGINAWETDQINSLIANFTNIKTGWSSISKELIKKIHGPNNIIEQLSYRKLCHHSHSDGIPLRTWKIVIDINEKPERVFINIIDKRHIWDPDITNTELVKELSESVELMKFTSKNPDGSFIPRQFYLFRGHKLGVQGYSHIIFSESVNCNLNNFNSKDECSGESSEKTLVGWIFYDNFMIESLCTKLTRVTWISRVDLYGHHSDWYANHWGHNLIRRALFLKRFSEAGNVFKLCHESETLSGSFISSNKDETSQVSIDVFSSTEENTDETH